MFLPGLAKWVSGWMCLKVQQKQLLEACWSWQCWGNGAGAQMHRLSWRWQQKECLLGFRLSFVLAVIWLNSQVQRKLQSSSILSECQQKFCPSQAPLQSIRANILHQCDK